MTAEAARQRAPERGFGLRAIYAVVFFGLAASAFAAAWPELTQLSFALSRTHHFGAAPRPLPIAGAGLVVVGLVVVFGAWARGRSAPLWGSVLILVAAVLPVLGAFGELPQGRSWAAADRAILDVASRLHRLQVEVLQQRSEVPRDAQAWQALLDTAAGDTPSPARTRSFARLPWRVERIPTPEDRPDPLVPSTVLVWVAPEGEAFELRPVGFTPEGKVGLLADDHGTPVVLKGTFNPDLEHKPRPPGLPALPGGAR